jgi:hypothetical protein
LHNFGDGTGNLTMVTHASRFGTALNWRLFLSSVKVANTKAHHQLKAPPPVTFTECARNCYRKLKNRNQNHVFYHYTFMQWRVPILQRDVLYTLFYGTCICISYAFYIK